MIRIKTSLSDYINESTLNEGQGETIFKDKTANMYIDKNNSKFKFKAHIAARPIPDPEKGYVYLSFAKPPLSKYVKIMFNGDYFQHVDALPGKFIYYSNKLRDALRQDFFDFSITSGGKKNWTVKLPNADFAQSGEIDKSNPVT
jgi:hypothetical protein